MQKFELVRDLPPGETGFANRKVSRPSKSSPIASKFRTRRPEFQARGYLHPPRLPLLVVTAGGGGTPLSELFSVPIVIRFDTFDPVSTDVRIRRVSHSQPYDERDLHPLVPVAKPCSIEFPFVEKVK